MGGTSPIHDNFDGTHGEFNGFSLGVLLGNHQSMGI